MRKNFVLMFMGMALCAASMCAMESELGSSNSEAGDSDSVDRCINCIVTTLPTVSAVMDGMSNNGGLNVRSITAFYDVATSTVRYHGLCTAEGLIAASSHHNALYAPLASLVISLAKVIPVVRDHIVQLEPDGNESSSSQASSTRTPISNAAYQLRKFNLNEIVLKILKDNEPKADDFLKTTHEFIKKNGDDIVSFLQDKDNRAAVSSTIHTIYDLYKEHGPTVMQYVKEHPQDLKQYAKTAQKYGPSIIHGINAAYAKYAEQQATNDNNDDDNDSFEDAENFDASSQSIALESHKYIDHIDFYLREIEGRQEGMTDWFK